MERFGRLHGRRFTDGMMSTLHDMMSRPRDSMPNAPTADLPPEDVSAEPPIGARECSTGASRGKGFGSRPCRMSIKYAALGTARPGIGLVNQRLKFRHPQSLTSSSVAGANFASAIALLALTTDQFQ